MDKPVNKAAVRRALSSLKKQRVINYENIDIPDTGDVRIEFMVNSELLMPKKRVYVKKPRATRKKRAED